MTHAIGIAAIALALVGVTMVFSIMNWDNTKPTPAPTSGGGFSETASDWVALDPISVARSRNALVALNGSLYDLGGQDILSNTMQANEAYSLFGERAWRPIANTSQTRSYFGAAALNNKVYVVGGFLEDNGDRTESGEVYDPVSNSWSAMSSDMSVGRALISLVAVDGKLYALGGVTDAEPLGTNTCEVYSPASDSWSPISPMPAIRRFMSAAAHQGKIYVAGGESGSFNHLASVHSDMYKYDPTTDGWLTLKPLTHSRTAFKLVALNSIIYALGGTNYKTPDVSTTERYDVATNTWSDMSSSAALTNMHFSAAAMYGIIYVAGGALPNYNHVQSAVSALMPALPVATAWCNSTQPPADPDATCVLAQSAMLGSNLTLCTI